MISEERKPPNPGKVRLVLADDQLLIRDMMRRLLGTDSEIEVVGEADDGKQAVHLVRELKPDVVLMDVDMPGMNGAEATAIIRREFPHVKVVILTAYGNHRNVFQAIRNGASGFLVKETLFDKVLEAVKTVARGDSILDPKTTNLVIEELTRLREGFASAQAASPPEDPLLSRLSQREQEIACLVAEGKTNKDIAEKLVLSENTVKRHIQNIM
ncbi:MAG: response regulator transcription factor, partial [Armatimonadetes bacterium]|nr:response regulator transcription factor [Armatimonadota bacterium]